MEDHTTGRRPTGDGDRRQRPDGAGTAVAAPVSRDAGEQPPDVIDVVFPVPGAGYGPANGTDRGPGGAAGAGSGRRERLRDRPLLLGAVSIAAVGIAAVIAWQVWPQPPGPVAPDRPRPRPSSAQPLDTGGISGRAAAPLPSVGDPRTSRAPAVDDGPSRTPSAPALPSVGSGTASPRPPSDGAVTPSATPSGSSASPSTTAPAPRTLRAGDSGSDVTELQRLLFAQGFTYVSLTGVYDDATVRGVTQVQQNRGITCDPYGVYGPCTRAALTS